MIRIESEHEGTYGSDTRVELTVVSDSYAPPQELARLLRLAVRDVCHALHVDVDSVLAPPEQRPVDVSGLHKPPPVHR